MICPSLPPTVLDPLPSAAAAAAPSSWQWSHLLFGQLFGATLIILGNVLDYYTTSRALDRGGRDVNPLINKKTLLPIKVGGTVAELLFMHFAVPSHAITLGVGVYTFFVVVSLWNSHHTPR